KRIIIIDEGRVKAQDTPENLTTQLRVSDKVRARIGGPKEDVVKALWELEGVKNVESGPGADSSLPYVVEFFDGALDRSSQVARAIVEKKWDLYELTPVKMSLEDIFIKIVTEEGI
ncbi:MAG: ABC transporter ATP-binding protein, partial [Nitrospinota bacterium]|nr:ABC transporter ATP-binding protein [Nitrospinota bacterium]